MNPFRWQELPPLENPVVLDLVFENCNFEDLKACRQVSKVWQQRSLKAWRSSVQVVIGEIDEYSVNTYSMSEFLEFVQNENSTHLECPFVTSYAVCEDSKRFWDLCGPSIKFLELYGSAFQSAHILRNIIFQFSPNMEHLALQLTKVSENSTSAMEEPAEFVEYPFGEHRKLKSLTIEAPSWLGDWPERNPMSWTELLSYFPSLETLNVSEGIPNLDGLFESFTLIRERDPEKLQLKHVSAVFPYGSGNPENIFPALKDSRLRLVSLEMQVNGHQEATEVHAILQIHASSLKKLTMYGALDMALNEPYNPLPSLSRDPLINLEELSIRWYTIDFLRVTPNLRKLTLLGGYLGLGNEMWEIADVNLTKCKELHIIHGYSGGDKIDEELRILGKWIPTLEILKLHSLRNDQFALVSQQWPDLMSLKIRACDVDDCGITGLDVEDVAKINENGWIQTWRPITVPRANITALKNLRSFCLTCSRNEADFGISSALYGFLKLPQLRNLNLNSQAILQNTGRQTPYLWKAVTDRWGI